MTVDQYCVNEIITLDLQVEMGLSQAAKEMFKRIYLKSHSERDFKGENNNINSDTDLNNCRDRICVLT